jgi:hypothetical protein
MVMTVIYTLVGIIALCGLIGGIVFLRSWFKSGMSYPEAIEHEYFNYFNSIPGVDPKPDWRRVLFVNNEYERLKNIERTAPRSIPKEWGDLPIDEFYRPKPVTKEDMKLKPLILEA